MDQNRENLNPQPEIDAMRTIGKSALFLLGAGDIILAASKFAHGEVLTGIGITVLGTAVIDLSTGGHIYDWVTSHFTGRQGSDTVE